MFHTQSVSEIVGQTLRAYSTHCKNKKKSYKYGSGTLPFQVINIFFILYLYLYFILYLYLFFILYLYKNSRSISYFLILWRFESFGCLYLWRLFHNSNRKILRFSCCYCGSTLKSKNFSTSSTIHATSMRSMHRCERKSFPAISNENIDISIK